MWRRFVTVHVIPHPSHRVVTGGTADITVHERLVGERLREVHHACGGPWGGTMVDSNFLKLLSTIVQPLTVVEFSKRYVAISLVIVCNARTCRSCM